MQWLTEHWLLMLPMILGAVSIGWLMPAGEPRSTVLARLLGVATLVVLGGTVLKPSGELLFDVLFYLFAGVAVAGAGLMITHRNPAYSALWFAVVTLSVCGLFLLQSAPFLASATVIVYAGAIIVTFLFVLMLAQQAGATNYDQRSRQPGLAAFTGFALLGAMLFVLTPGKSVEGESPVVVRGFAPLVAPTKPVVAQVEESPEPSMAALAQSIQAPTSDTTGGAETPRPAAASTSTPAPKTFGSMRALGRSLFGDYLFAVELAGTLLLVASIGAIVIAPKRSTGKL